MRIDTIKNRNGAIELTGSFQLTDLHSILSAVNGILDIHQRLANDVYPDGVELQCLKCSHVIIATTADCAHYLAHGWPRHCGREMRQPTIRQEDE
ncbi:MAG TPA: hypothetical protein PL105_22400 [Caldilineaceae bacterium]|nr:hypothetical protein [Caldilineaceae bacterium]